MNLLKQETEFRRAFEESEGACKMIISFEAGGKIFSWDRALSGPSDFEKARMNFRYYASSGIDELFRPELTIDEMEQDRVKSLKMAISSMEMIIEMDKVMGKDTYDSEVSLRHLRDQLNGI